MKLKNKRTGEIGELQVTEKHCAVAVGNGTASCGIEIYSSLTQLFKEWEDVLEGPKEYWFIENDGDISSIGVDEDFAESLRASKEIGNYFETKEEAEKAVGKLKALKRLKDKGFRFIDSKIIGEYGNVSYRLNYPATAVEEKDLDLLFRR